METKSQTPQTLIFIEKESPEELRTKIHNLFNSASEPLQNFFQTKTGGRFKRSLIENLITMQRKLEDDTIEGSRWNFHCITPEEARNIGNIHKSEIVSIFENNLNVTFKKFFELNKTVCYIIARKNFEED